jgi:hypothetical protein
MDTNKLEPAFVSIKAVADYAGESEWTTKGHLEK